MDGAKRSGADSIAGERRARATRDSNLGTLVGNAGKEEGNGGVSVNVDSDFV
jgi:hypothetical protein